MIVVTIPQRTHLELTATRELARVIVDTADGTFLAFGREARAIAEAAGRALTISAEEDLLSLLDGRRAHLVRTAIVTNNHAGDDHV